MSNFIEQAYAQAWTGTRSNPAVISGMKVYPQTNNWSCGPMALRHCLLKLGTDVNQREIARLAYSTRAGTGDLNMQLAAHKLGFSWHQHTLLTSKSAKETIERLLKKGQPLILCVEKWEHWIAVIHHSQRGYLIFDSSRPGPVIQLHGWAWLRKRLRYVPKETKQPIFAVASVSRGVHRNR